MSTTLTTIQTIKPGTTVTHASIFSHLNLFHHLEGIVAGAFHAVAPILKGAFGEFLQTAIPLAEQLVIQLITQHGTISDASRNDAANQIINAVKLGGTEITQGMGKLAIDLAYHGLKTQGAILTSAAPTQGA